MTKPFRDLTINEVKALDEKAIDAYSMEIGEALLKDPEQRNAILTAVGAKAIRHHIQVIKREFPDVPSKT